MVALESAILFWLLRENHLVFIIEREAEYLNGSLLLIG